MPSAYVELDDLPKSGAVGSLPAVDAVGSPDVAQICDAGVALV